MKKHSRRDFLKVFGLSGAGLMLAAYVPANTLFSKPGDSPTVFSPSVFLSIDPNGIVTIMIHKAEIGQGISTALPMLIAEELEVNWEKIKIQLADGDLKYGGQTTGGSSTMRNAWQPFRVAGATARIMLVTAAANIWKIDPAKCKAEDGFVINTVNGKKIDYGSLVAEAAKLPIPVNVPLKDPRDFKIIGQRVHRLDTPDKVHGNAKFGIDVVVPGMFFAAVARCPSFGGSVKKYDDTLALKRKGVKKICKISSGIAVIAETTWQAFDGKDKLSIEWDLGPNGNISSADIHKSMEDKLNIDGDEITVVGNPDSITADEQIIEAVYETPFQAHATMEPMNCIAKVTGGKVEIWAPTQNPQVNQKDVSKKLGFKIEDITVHVTLMGGGFGRRLESDFVLEAVELAKVSGQTVKIEWTREDDMRHGVYRPVAMNKLKGSIDKNGKPVRLLHHVVAASIRAQRSDKKLTPNQYDFKEAALPTEYNIPNMKLTGTIQETHIPLGYWRSVYQSQNPFAVECFIDEMAYLAKKDPFDFRKEMMPEDTRLRQVMFTAAEKSGWGKKLEQGRGMGMAVTEGFQSYCVEVAEVSINEKNELKIEKIVCVVDCGIVINPDTLEAQIQGGVAWGLSAALKTEITIRNGGVEQGNWDDFPILRFDEMPKVEVYIMQNTYPVGGIGELGVAASAPALCNAIFAATGKRYRKLPLSL